MSCINSNMKYSFKPFIQPNKSLSTVRVITNPPVCCCYEYIMAAGLSSGHLLLYCLCCGAVRLFSDTIYNRPAGLLCLHTFSIILRLRTAARRRSVITAPGPVMAAHSPARCQSAFTLKVVLMKQSLMPPLASWTGIFCSRPLPAGRCCLFGAHSCDFLRVRLQSFQAELQTRAAISED